MQTLFNVITVLSFIMTATTWIVGALSRSVRLDFDVLDRRTYLKSCTVYVRIVNKSFWPIVINSISMIDGDHEQFCYLQQKHVRHDHTIEYYTAVYPINLAAHEGGQYYVTYRHFPKNKPTQLVEGKKVAFRIYTNRTVLKREIVLGKPDYYLHIRPERTETGE